MSRRPAPAPARAAAAASPRDVGPGAARGRHGTRPRGAPARGPRRLSPAWRCPGRRSPSSRLDLDPAAVAARVGEPDAVLDAVRRPGALGVLGPLDEDDRVGPEEWLEQS